VKVSEITTLEQAYEYLNDLAFSCKGRDLEFEALIKNDPGLVFYYATIVLKDRFLEGEECLLKERADFLYAYVVGTCKRFPKAEPKIREDKVIWDKYLEAIKNLSNTEKRQWLKDEGLTDELFEVLNHLGMPVDVQEAVIKLRPDLIGEIGDLDSSLRVKYQHELELGRVDL
jgi:hypothetical protein